MKRLMRSGLLRIFFSGTRIDAGRPLRTAFKRG